LLPITAGNDSQRFEALALDTDGSVFAAWLDKRNRVPAQQRGQNTKVPACFAFSKDGGATYSKSVWRRTIPASAAASGWFAGPGRPVIVFRNILRAVFGITRS
jgi:hypothetical protein